MWAKQRKAMPKGIGYSSTSKQRAVPATVKRAKKYGTANQMAHEAEGRFQREEMKKRMKRDHDARRKQAATSPAMRKKAAKAKEKGMSAGTMGGSRTSGTSKNSLINALFGR